MKERLALLISGSGTTAEAVIKACQQKKLLDIEPVGVISSRSDALGIEEAHKLGVKTFVLRPADFPNAEEFGQNLLAILKSLNVDLVSQNGWLPLTPANVVEEYRGRIINQHPGPLDPEGGLDFGGKGMHGARVTCARLVYVWVAREENPWTESTIHYVTKEYDGGDLIRVVKMTIPRLGRPVTIAELKEDGTQLVGITREVQRKLLPLEHKNVIHVLQALAKGEELEYRRSEPLIPRGSEQILYQAKNLAIDLFPGG